MKSVNPLQSNKSTIWIILYSEICQKLVLHATSGVDFINILGAAFVHADPKSVNQIYNFIVFSALLGSMRVKAASKHIDDTDP